MAVARLTVTRSIKDTVLANSSKVVDSVPLTAIDCVEYLLSAKKGDRTVVKALKLIAHKTDTDLLDTVSSRLGTLNVSVTLQINAGYLELLLQNNEAFDVSISAVRAIA